MERLAIGAAWIMGADTAPVAWGVSVFRTLAEGEMCGVGGATATGWSAAGGALTTTGVGTGGDGAGRTTVVGGTAFSPTSGTIGFSAIGIAGGEFCAGGAKGC